MLGRQNCSLRLLLDPYIVRPFCEVAAVCSFGIHTLGFFSKGEPRVQRAL